jgi:hypothetical protein
MHVLIKGFRGFGGMVEEAEDARLSNDINFKIAVNN